MTTTFSRPLFVLAIASLLSFLLLFGCLGSSDQTAPPSYNPNPSLPAQQYVRHPTPLPGATAPPAGLQMNFINVGYGDATLMRSGAMTVLFDTGPASSAPQVIDYLRAQGIEKIDVLVLSSSNPTFVGGAPAVMRQFVVGQVWSSGVNSSDPTSQAIAQMSQYLPQQAVRYGYAQSWNGFNLTVLNPTDPLQGNPDSDSVVLKASYGGFCAILMSNSEASGAAGNDGGTVVGGVDARIISGVVPIACPILRVSHHGSGNAASFQLLQFVHPEAGIISVGPNPPTNSYPEPTLIRRLMLRNVSVYTTDRLGTITVSTDGNTYNISSERPADDAYWRSINDVAYNGAAYWPK